MTDFAALAQEAVQFMADNQLAVDAHQGAAWTENKLLRAVSGVESAGGTTALSYSYGEALKRSVLQVNNRAEAYTFTHAIFFGTDFGKKSLTGIDVTAYSAAIETHIFTYANDFDVLGEMLTAAKCLGYWSTNLDSARDSFVTAWQALDRNDFAQNYHTILVGGILFSMMG